jgi:uncharacterized protein YjiS (DUF1127 family)
MIMSTIFNKPVAAEVVARRSRTGGLGAFLKRWWGAYITWRIERAVIAQLWSISDRELKDIGLTHSEITGAVRNVGGTLPRIQPVLLTYPGQKARPHERQ